MSSAYRYGNWDGAFNGDTASEIAQSRTDRDNHEIRRAGRFIPVMSEKQWQEGWPRRANSAWPSRPGCARSAADGNSRTTTSASTRSRCPRSCATTTRCPTAAALLAYHYQLDTDKGIVPGPYLRNYPHHTIRLDIPRGDKLRDYFNHRGLSAPDDELRYFEGCISKKASPLRPLSRVSKTDDKSLAAHKNLLTFILEDDLIREEITEVLLVSIAK
ncbi:hypothetical protein PG984_015380 [Apiospora sp. TS-2023a]